MKLVRITEKTYMMDIGITTVCLYIPDGKNAVLIDSGQVESEKLSELFEREGVRIQAIINSHLHYDHILNNGRLKREFDCSIYCSPDEIRYVKKLFEDNNRGDELNRTRLFSYSFCRDFIDSICENPKEGTLSLEEMGIKGEGEFTFISTPGHSAGHQLVGTPDGVLYIGDAVMSPDVLADSKLPYLFTLPETIESMRLLAELDYPYFVASHRGQIGKEILKKTVKDNILKEEEVQELLMGSLPERCSIYDIEEHLMRSAGITHPKILATSWMHEAVLARIFEFVKRGIISIEGTEIVKH